MQQEEDEEKEREHKIQTTSQKVDELHVQRLADEKQYESMKQDYVRLN